MRHFGCCFCKATVDDIRKLFPTLIKLNTIPVFVHMESKEEAEKFFNSVSFIYLCLSIISGDVRL